MTQPKININYRLFEETSHSPALIDIVGEENMDKVIDYCFIANPYYPTNDMMELLKSKFTSIIKAYPSSNPRLARENLAQVLNVDPDHLILGNGATELITIIEKQIIEKLAIPIPTFSEYIDKLKDQNLAIYYHLKADEDYQLNLDAYANWLIEQQINSALVINPGNPTGQLFHIDEMKAFLNKVSELECILIDESFIDFADEEIPSLLPYIKEFNNVIVIRSMSKHCGVPGLRLGYCCTSNHTFAQKMHDALPIWNINSIAEYLLLQLSKTNDIYHKTRLRVISDTQHLYQKLKTIPGYKIYPTGSNFIMIKIQNGKSALELQKKLLEDYGLYVRDCSNKIGLDNFHIRVASQGKAKDQFLIDALKTIQ